MTFWKMPVSPPKYSEVPFETDVLDTQRESCVQVDG